MKKAAFAMASLCSGARGLDRRSPAPALQTPRRSPPDRSSPSPTCTPPRPRRPPAQTFPNGQMSGRRRRNRRRSRAIWSATRVYRSCHSTAQLMSAWLCNLVGPSAYTCWSYDAGATVPDLVLPLRCDGCCEGAVIAS